MALEKDSDILGHTEKTSLSSDDFGLLQSNTDKKTYRFALSMLGIQPSTNYAWVSSFSYVGTDQVVQYGGVFWHSIQSPNQGNVPMVGSLFWELITVSTSGLTPWAAGAFVDNNAFVLYDENQDSLNPDWGLYYLVSAVRPFVSTNFVTERTAGKWVNFVPPSVVGTPEHWRGAYDASTNLLPATPLGSLGGNPQAGDEWVFNVAATNIGGEPYPVGTLAKALINSPGQTLSNWRLIS